MKKYILICAAAILAGCSQNTRFKLIDPESSGIDFQNIITENDTFHILTTEYIYNGGGVGVADFDNDGLPDLVFTGNQVPSRVYRNKGNLTFEDVTAQFEGLTNDQWYSGVAIADVNGDGYDDLYLTSTLSKDPAKRANRLWVSTGGADFPKFTEQSEDFGVADTGNSVHAGFLDYDLDGDLDLYVLNNVVNQHIPTNYRQRITDGTAINNDKLYRNNGDLTFTDVTTEAGIVYEGYGLGLGFSDVNKDGYPDIHVANDYIALDLLYINQGDGTFKNNANKLSYHSKFSMGNDITDVNNDGLTDIMTLDMMPEKYFRKKQTINGNSYFFYTNDAKFDYQHQYGRNMLHMHNGFVNDEMLSYSEVGQMSGIYQTEWSWSPLFADYDNDGDKDLLITNGYPKDVTDKDFVNYKAQVGGYVATDQQVLSKVPVVRVSNYAFEQTGDLSFRDVTTEWGMERPSFSYGAAFTDLDRDGDLDYVVSNIDDNAFVYENTTAGESNNYLQIALQGNKGNRHGLGAKVSVWTAGEMQFQELYITRGYISSLEPILHFGFGSHATVDSIKVEWPGGNVSSLTNIATNQLISISQDDAKPGQPQIMEIDQADAQAYLSYTHEQKDYIDFFQNQNIIPHKFSQIGPCMAKGDLTNDGKEDLLIGGTDAHATLVFAQTDAGFEPVEIPGLTTQKQCTEGDLLIFDIDGDNDQDVVAVAGGYANEDPGDYKHKLYVNQGGTFETVDLNLNPFPAACVRAFDYDQDGDLDIFVGARVSKGNFPTAPASVLMRNDEGVFTTEREFEMGMVTDALWMDVNNDGYEDLVVAREWSSLGWIENQNGSFKELAPLSDRSGAWTSLEKVDLDGDGDMDIVAGNLGLNHRFNVSDTYPMKLYAVDLDQNGSIDPVTTAFWENANGRMEEYPINFLDELAAQSPVFRKLFTSYTSFSYSSIEKVFDPELIPEKNTYFINDTRSYVLWNTDSGFEWEALPKLAQVAPIRKMLAVDIDKDGTAEVILGGNDHTYDVSTGIYNANRGLILKAEKDRSLRLLTPSETGYVVDGQVEALIHFQGDKEFVVTGINRAAAQVYEIN